MVFDGAILMMPCLGNVWEDVQDLWRPEFFVLFVIFLCWAPLIKRRLLKIPMRITGGLLSACFVAVLGVGVWLSSFSEVKYLTVSAPDGLHQAVLKYEPGLMGRDFTEVTINRAGRCRKFRAYSYTGPNRLTGTKMEWIDNSRLRIVQEDNHPAHGHDCETHVADVTVICTYD